MFTLDFPETFFSSNFEHLMIFSAWDLKLANMLLGLSAHGAKFGCLFCEGEKKLECGELRTFGSLGILDFPLPTIP